MKAGLVTFYHIHHYGALLQAAATERAVEQAGGECEIIDYYVNQNNDLFRKPTGLGSAAADAHTALHYAALKTRYDRFEQFAKDHLRISGHRFESGEELRAAELPYDVILSGSDQIWNPKIFPNGRFDPVFFGEFSPRRKIAYAPSFGVPHIPSGMERELREYLAHFSHLSVRERQGQAIVREVAGVKVPVVLDPTLLLTSEQWSAMAKPPVKLPQGGYLLCYCISAPGPLEPYIRALAEKTGLPVVQLCGARQKVHPKARCVLDAGPAEFLGLFQNAACVCTNSFHGTVFSVQFQKPFFTAVAPGELAEPESSRTFSILSRLGLTDRIIGKGDTAEIDAPVDWAAVSKRLEDARRSSLDYLRAALQNEPYCPQRAADSQDAALPTLAGHSLCTGCGACMSGCPKDAISMERDREGFSYPVVNGEKCVHCGRCTAVCPLLHEREKGPLPAVYAAWHKDDGIRKDSTSGGAFTALAEYVLEGGGVVYGAAFDAKQHLRHVACFRKEELWRLRGAKYVQSDLGDTFREIRAALENRPVLFTGTPCQVDGLYRYLGSRPENLTTCDLVCHGVPSPGVWEDMARSIEHRKGKKLQAVRFRNKVTGWKDSHFTTVYDDGTVDTAPLFRTEYGRAFGRSLFLRPSCHHCAYTSMTRPGDFTLGDFWGLRPEELPDEQSRGVSLLMVNTPHASHIFDQLPLARKAFPPERAIAGNPRLASPVPTASDRAAFFAAYALEPFDAVRRKFCTLPPLPVRMATRLLSPEAKEKLRKKLR
ncbi:polysaccharide pyruvyl transferase family protein [Oscillibacter sp.]|uniref:polysaccharide pyruvyl transferase family protein n=1 Tax=Oscillibacter sp. TaxID=1945593 RepID=UPI0026323574|nr:polysaccharide pyruvyl transferase family protein [Oscillibacter sp.]MDD3346609.1 polysaccharide pyruvyl transferase family protein [Oscillibacter sp.]